jgi:ABC-type ATPase involved in cell division
MPDVVFPMKTSRYFFIDGVTGAGKTTVAAMLSLMGQDLNESVGVIGPNKNQAEKLNVSLGKPPKSKVWSKKDLFN